MRRLGLMRTHPAETTTGGGAVALLIALVLGLDAETAAIIGVALGLVPALVTGLVRVGGITGAVQLLLRGERGQADVVTLLLIVFLVLVILVVLGRV